MPLPIGLPIVDHHCHLSPTGEGVAAARRFRAAGGTHLFLATQNYGPGPAVTLEDYRRQFDTTERLGRQVEAEAGVRVYLVVAPYPIDLIGASAAIGPEAAFAAHAEALELAGAWVKERRAVALGEVGRAHFPVAAPAQELLERALQKAFEVARDVGCPIVFHSADLEPSDFLALAAFARAAGVPAGRVVKHFARKRWTSEEYAGIVPSYLARRELVREVRPDPGPWFLETDFLDDPTRPGAVLDLATVPRRAAAWSAEGEAMSERLRVPFVESVRQVYGFEPELTGGRPR